MVKSSIRRCIQPIYECILNFPRKEFHSTSMANSKYEYVKQFETHEKCLLNCWIVVRIDGKAFHRFTEKHKFEKPNDLRALNLMTCAAKYVMSEFRDIVLAYGQSDEYSFVLRKETEVYNRRSDKLMSYVCSLFTSAFVFNWSQFFGEQKLQYPPSFDGRVVLYPTDSNLRDYLSWRQADTHINNLYNTCFWNLVLKKNFTHSQAQEQLKGTFAADKNELLFQEFGINYNNEPEIFRKGTTLVRLKGGKVKALEVDIIGNTFWNEHVDILTPRKKSTKDASTHMEPLGLSEIPEIAIDSAYNPSVSISDNQTQTSRSAESTTQTQTSVATDTSTQTSKINIPQHSYLT